MRLLVWTPVFLWGLMNLVILADAFGDAFFKKKKWIMSKLFQVLMLFCFAGIVILIYYGDIEFIPWWKWFYLALSYILIRIGIFNVFYELAFVGFKLKKWWWWHLGTTDLWDRFLNWVIHYSYFGKKVKPDQKFFLSLFYPICEVLSLAPIIQGFLLIAE
jgi:hypothetical protein